MNLVSCQSSGVRLATLLLTISGITADAAAQDVPIPPPNGFEQGTNGTIGDFLLYSRIQAGLQHTTNVRQDPTEQTDQKALVNANVMARSTWDRHALALTAAYARQRAIKTRNQDAEALSGSISGKYDLTDQLSIRGGLLHTESIVGKNDPQQFIGNLNGTTVVRTGELGFSWESPTYFANLETRLQDVDNKTAIDVTLLSRVQQQDRVEFDGTFQFGRNYPWGKAYMIAGGQQIQYSGSDFILPEDRDSVGLRGGFGVEYASGDLRAIVRLIGFNQEFNAPTIGTATGVVGIAEIGVKATDKLAFGATIERSFDEINIQGSAGLYTNTVSVGTQYQFRDDLYVRFGPSYHIYQIEGTPLEAESISLDGALAWQIDPRVELLLNFQLFNQTVNDATLQDLEYEETAVTVSTVFSF